MQRTIAVVRNPLSMSQSGGALEHELGGGCNGEFNDVNSNKNLLD